MGDRGIKQSLPWHTFVSCHFPFRQDFRKFSKISETLASASLVCKVVKILFSLSETYMKERVIMHGPGSELHVGGSGM